MLAFLRSRLVLFANRAQLYRQGSMRLGALLGTTTQGDGVRRGPDATFLSDFLVPRTISPAAVICPSTYEVAGVKLLHFDAPRILPLWRS